MLFDIGWSELMLIGVVALVVIGPKDLPKALRVAGYWVRKARSLSREFQSGVDQMIREAELEEMREQLKKASQFDIDKEFRNTVDPSGKLAESLRPPDLPDLNGGPDRPATSQAPPPDPVALPAGSFHEALPQSPPESLYPPLHDTPVEEIALRDPLPVSSSEPVSREVGSVSAAPTPVPSPPVPHPPAPDEIRPPKP